MKIFGMRLANVLEEQNKLEQIEIVRITKRGQQILNVLKCKAVLGEYCEAQYVS